MITERNLIGTYRRRHRQFNFLIVPWFDLAKDDREAKRQNQGAGIN